MEQGTCINCGSNFQRSPRHKNQNYCSKKACQRARKADWQRGKMRTDPEYRAGQRLSQKKWADNNPGYWKQYRAKNKDQAERNRLLQRLRNKRHRVCPGTIRDGSEAAMIAKMDASEQVKTSIFKVMGQYWLVPIIAKMDALKVNIVVIADGYE